MEIHKQQLQNEGARLELQRMAEARQLQLQQHLNQQSQQIPTQISSVQYSTNQPLDAE